MLTSRTSVSYKQSSLQLDRFRDDTHLKVFGDHLQCDLEDCLKDGGHLLGHAILQLVDDGRKQTQYFCIPANMHQEGCQRMCSRQKCPRRNVAGGMLQEEGGMLQEGCCRRNVAEEMWQEECCRSIVRGICGRNVAGALSGEFSSRRNVAGAVSQK